MPNKRRAIPTRFQYHRPILSDVLPFEVPPIFGNLGYFDFLSRHDVRLRTIGGATYVQWICDDDSIDLAIQTVFGAANNVSKMPKQKHPPGYAISTPFRYCLLNGKEDWTIPFSFDIAHKDRDSRRLTIIHPKSQLFVAEFYASRSSEILYHTSRSEFSIRYPARVARTSYFRDNLYAHNRGSTKDSVEESSKEYENLGSYFAYERYSNIFKFYESYQYHNAERKFDRLLKLDISKCFDSIYTHSAAWTVLGARANKDHIAASRGTFGGSFDKLMQIMNQGETNGIVIGPEFSRIFAEIILQGVDRKLLHVLKSEENLTHKLDYQIFRYVDDYFIFHNHSVDVSCIERRLGELLKQVKLSLNKHKSDTFSKPLITPQTIAKNKTKHALASHVGVTVQDLSPVATGAKSKKKVPFIHTNSLIVDFKTIIHESKVQYTDLLNYTFASIEGSVKDFFVSYADNDQIHKDQEKLTTALIGVLEFCFFSYSAAPKVNFTIRLVRIVSMIADGMKSVGLDYDFRHQVLKFAHDNIVRQLKRTGRDKYRYVETMYLLLGLEKLGRKYLLDETSLAEFFGVQHDGTNYSAPYDLDYFAITVCLMCTKKKVRFTQLRMFLEQTIVERLERNAAYLASDTECTLLFLDIMCCPFISSGVKSKASHLFAESQLSLQSKSVTSAAVASRAVELQKSLLKASPFWFVNWSGYDLSVALDNKRAREVY